MKDDSLSKSMNSNPPTLSSSSKIYASIVEGSNAELINSEGQVAGMVIISV